MIFMPQNLDRSWVYKTSLQRCEQYTTKVVRLLYQLDHRTDAGWQIHTANIVMHGVRGFPEISSATIADSRTLA